MITVAELHEKGGFMKIFGYYMIAINLFTFFLFGFDKQKAKRGLWRISEKILLFFSAIGGSIGALIGMYIWHHKTKHAKFYLGVPILLVIQVVIFYLVLNR